MDKLKVFVSHTFDKTDADIISRILEIMRRQRFHLDVQTAQPPQSRSFPDKIRDWIDWADVTFGIFTKRGRSEGGGESYPSHFVVSECSTALGRYWDNDRKAVVGILEEPIEHETLGLIAARGEDIPSFNRAGILANNATAIGSLERYFYDLY